ncbi:MAG: mannosyltransferase family protein [Actinomycetes bacterium]
MVVETEQPAPASGLIERIRTWPDLPSATIWLATRLSVYTAAWFATWAFAATPDVLQGDGVPSGPSGSFADMWNRWDADRFKAINQFGYGAPGDETNYAFFPGFPLIVRLVHLTGLDLTISGLIVAFVAGLFAAIALGRLTQLAGGRPELGVLAWAIAPVAVYLAAPYSEALFCAFAFWCWYSAKRGWWVFAGVMGMLAALVRINGAFLGIALIVLFLTSRNRDWRQSPALALPFVGVAVVFAVYRWLSGSWTIWFWAQGQGWSRHLSNPIEAWRTEWDWAWNYAVAAPWAVQYRFEILYVVLLITFVVVLLVKRWWGEATFVLLTVASLATSTVFQSVPRSSIVLFPIWILLGVWMTRSIVFRIVLVSVFAPLMLVSVATYVNAYWVS